MIDIIVLLGNMAAVPILFFGFIHLMLSCVVAANQAEEKKNSLKRDGETE